MRERAGLGAREAVMNEIDAVVRRLVKPMLLPTALQFTIAASCRLSSRDARRM